MTTPLFFHKRVHWKILDQFIANPYRQYSFSDLVKLTKAGPTNVSKALNELRAKRIFRQQQVGNKLIYQLDLHSHLVRSLILLYAWNRVQDFPEKARKALTALVEKCRPFGISSMYLFGSAVYSAAPRDIDVAIVSAHHQTELEKIWLQVMKDFEENIEMHFFPKQEFIRLWKEGDYTVTSTLVPSLILYDQNFLFDYLGTVPLPSRKLLQSHLNELELKIERALQLYRNNKKESAELVESMFNDFLRLYIAYKQDIPGSKHHLRKQAQQQGLIFKKRTLWETLEWMEQTLRKIKTSI